MKPKPGKIRRNDSIPLSKHGNQIAEHVRGRREAVQQENYRRVLWTGFAIKDLMLQHLREPVMHLRLRTLFHWFCHSRNTR